MSQLHYGSRPVLEQVDPFPFFEFQSFEESSILRVACSFRRRWLELVIDWPAPRVIAWYEAQLTGRNWDEFRRVNPPPRDLRELVFCDIRQLRCGRHDIRRRSDWPAATRLLSIPGEAIRSIALDRDGGTYRIDLELQHVNPLHLRFEQLLVDGRVGRDEAPGAYVSLWDPECTDLRTGEHFVYETPFPFPDVVQLGHVSRSG